LPRGVGVNALSIVKPLAGLLLAAAFCMTAVSVYSAPGRMDPTKRARVSTEKKADLPDAVEIKQNEVLQDRRFSTGEVREKKDAIVGERRSAIEVEETREKKMAPTRELIEPDQIPRKESVWNGKQSKFSTGEDTYRTRVATRFQDKIGDASPFPAPARSVTDQRTTFSKVNRFAFRKNGDQAITTSTAGGETGSGNVSDRSGLAPGSPTVPDSNR
jgi:hypothetical protein